MSETVEVELLTSVELAAKFRTTRRHITDLANTHGIGFNLGGSAGFRFTPADVVALREALKPQQASARRRRRRSS